MRSRCLRKRHFAQGAGPAADRLRWRGFEAFKLGTRVLTFDKVRLDPHEPDAYGATITYDFAGYNRKEEACVPATA